VRATLDHVGLIVPGLDEAGRLFEALGFTLTRRAEHRREGPDGAPEPAGSAQRSIMFERGYIELQEITDPQERHLLSPAKAKHYGAHILAFGVEDAGAARDAAGEAGLALGPVFEWGRPIAEEDARGEARFRFFVADYQSKDEALLCWTEHLTPALLRSPRLTAHENGAEALAGITIAVESDAALGEVAARLRAAGGRPLDGARLAFGEAVVTLATQASLPPALSRRPAPAPRHVAAVSIALARPDRLAEAARALGLGIEEAGGRVTLDLGERFGVFLVGEAPA